MTYFLVGERIGLRPLELRDAEGPYPGWLNDAEVSQFNSHHLYPYDREQARAYIASVSASRRELVLAIEEKTAQKHLGNVALQAIDLVSRTAEFSIAIGDRAWWGQGIGVEVGRLVFGHAFQALGVHRIGCGTTADNEGMKKLATALGMREEDAAAAPPGSAGASSTSSSTASSPKKFSASR